MKINLQTNIVFGLLLAICLEIGTGLLFVQHLPEENGVGRSTPASLLPEKVSCAVKDRQEFQLPGVAHLTGWTGARLNANEMNRLVKIDPARLLEGYRKRPGRQTWDGEHVGKWLHAATLAWAYSGDEKLRKKLDYVAAELCKCQLPDGYLGTYTADKRWSEWDVWAHKYNLIGLITYMRYTGETAPLPTCKRMARLLCDTFGDEPGKRDIIDAGFHTGMAPTSVLEPMVLLYRLTGEPRYLEFCKYILRAWEHPNGPHIISRLLDLKRVDKVGNAKAYEMLSCLNGALELYRTTGDRRLLDASLNAWQDIVDKRLYITGAASHNEHFYDDYDLPNTGDVGETCVTVTWLQLNAQLLRLTGEARFAEQLERVVLNQLFGAEKPDGTAWGYYVQMEGKKPYSATLDGHCCLSSGPRGVALIPTFAATTDGEGVVVNIYDPGTARLPVRGGAVRLSTSTLFPADGKIQIDLEPADVGESFTVKLRLPAWSRENLIEVNGKKTEAQRGADGYAAIKRNWASGDRITLKLKLEPHLVIGDHKNTGKAAVLYGPLVLAADEALLDGKKLAAVSLARADIGALAVTPEPAPEKLKTWPGSQVFRINCASGKSAKLVPFADAGSTGSSYMVWLPIGKK